MQAYAFDFIKNLSVNWNIEKSMSRNSEGLKRGTKRLNMENTQIFQPLFICPNLIMIAVNHCTKYDQSKT